MSQPRNGPKYYPILSILILCIWYKVLFISVRDSMAMSLIVRNWAASLLSDNSKKGSEAQIRQGEDRETWRRATNVVRAVAKNVPTGAQQNGVRTRAYTDKSLNSTMTIEDTKPSWTFRPSWNNLRTLILKSKGTTERLMNTISRWPDTILERHNGRSLLMHFIG